MPLDGLAQALKNGGVKFDVLDFYACLMGSVEVALELQPYADVLVGSEQTAWGGGLDFVSVLNAVTQNPGITSLELGKAGVDGYFEALRKSTPYLVGDQIWSVTDLRQVPALKQALTAFVADLNRYVLTGTSNNTSERLPRLGQVMGQARYETPAFASTAPNDPGKTFDLGILADNAAKYTGDASISTSAAGLRKALSAAVKYVKTGDALKGLQLSGLSIAVPVHPKAAARTGFYTKLSETGQTKWPETISAFAAAMVGDKVPPKVANIVTDKTEIVQGQSKARISGAVTDETLVSGVVVGVVGIVDKQTFFLNFDEQPRTYRTTNEFTYDFDGTTWYMQDGNQSQPVFSVKWHLGQRAVYGLYRQTPRDDPSQAAFFYEETSGKMLGGLWFVSTDEGQGVMGSIGPSADSTFQPFIYTEDLTPKPLDAVKVLATTLEKRPLPAGDYLITATGFDLGQNHATKGVVVAIGAPAGQDKPQVCAPTDDDAAAAYGTHDLKLTLDPGQTITLKLPIDRNRVGKVSHVVDEVGFGDTASLRITGPDGNTNGASGKINGHASDSFVPPLSGNYLLTLTNPLTGQKTIFLSWTISARSGSQPPAVADLDKDPGQADSFSQPGLHAATLTIPAGQSLSLSIEMDANRTPWLGYSVELSADQGSLVFGTLSADGKAQDATVVCRLHMGGYRLPASGEQQLVFNNKQGKTPRLVTFWVEPYDPAARSAPTSTATPRPASTPTPTPVPAPTPTVQEFPDFGTGDHLQDLVLQARQIIAVMIPFDSARSRRAVVALSNQGGSGSVVYTISAPDKTALASGTIGSFTQDGFDVNATGKYTILLDNSGNPNSRTVRLSMSVRPR